MCVLNGTTPTVTGGSASDTGVSCTPSPAPVPTPTPAPVPTPTPTPAPGTPSPAPSVPSPTPAPAVPSPAPAVPSPAPAVPTPTPATPDCTTWTLICPSGSSGCNYSYVDCNNVTQTGTLPGDYDIDVCVKQGTTPNVTGGDANNTNTPCSSGPAPAPATPTPAPATPAPAAATTFSHATQQNGGTSSVACAGTTNNAIYTSRATVADIQVGDIMYANFSQTIVWNGGTEYYGLSNINGKIGADYAMLINSSGEVLAITDCSVSPSPTPATPTPAVNSQEIAIEPCEGGSTYYVEALGVTGLTVGRGIKFSSGGVSGGCPTFDTTQCYVITAVDIGYHNCQGVWNQTSSNCAGLTGCTAPSPAPVPTPTPAPATPTPAPSVSYDNYIINRCDGGFNNYTVGRALSGTFPTNDALLMPDGNCYQIQDPTNTTGTLANAVYTNCNSCSPPSPTPAPSLPVPTPTPKPSPAPAPSAPSPAPSVPTPVPTAPSPAPAVPSPAPAPAVPSPAPAPSPSPSPAPTPTPTACIGISVGHSTGLYYGCCVPPDSQSTYYFNAASVASATRMYSDFTCTKLDTGTRYVSENGSVYYTFVNGVKSGGAISCPGCP